MQLTLLNLRSKFSKNDIKKFCNYLEISPKKFYFYCEKFRNKKFGNSILKQKNGLYRFFNSKFQVVNYAH